MRPLVRRWRRGHFGRFWNIEEIKKFNYIRLPLPEKQEQMYRSQGYNHEKLTGEVYDNKNPMPEFVGRFEALFGEYKNFTYSFYKMKTLDIMPTHIDHYNYYRKLHNVSYKDCVRILVMLEDWKPGHYLEIDGEGVTSWIAGDYFVWENDVPHAAANIGLEDRYTLQITATDTVENKVWKNIHWFNIPNARSRDYSEDEFVQQRLLKSINYNNGKPLFVYMNNGTIDELEEFKHDDQTIIELNRTGVDIYLYEPICGYNVDSAEAETPIGLTKHNFIFYSEFQGNEPCHKLRAPELDSIVKYVSNNNLTNVTVHTCDYNIEKFYTLYNNHFKLVCDDLFLKSTYFTKPVNTEFDDDFKYKFINCNWRYTHHRHYIAAYLKNCSSLVSWYYRADLSVSKAEWTNYFLWPNNTFLKVIRGIEDLNHLAPANIDLNVSEAVNLFDHYQKGKLPQNKSVYEVGGNDVQQKIEEHYRQIFCDVVSESRFAQPTANFSEKTYTPMFYKKPFILAAPPRTLQYMREQGYKTFSDFWDESYDLMDNHEQRLFAIFKVIDSIESKSMDELRQMYRDMQPILQHNFDLLQQKVYHE